MRVAFFARYSSKLQDEMSLEAQQAEMERYCSARGWSIVARYLLPETRSANIEKSEEFRDMMAAAKRKSFDVLLLHRSDRFGRNREHAVLHKAALRRLGIQVTSVVEGLDGESMMDRAMEGMLEVMAEWTAASIGLETKKGHSQLIRKGYWCGGKVPWGLSVEETPDGHKRLVSDPQRASVLRRAFEMVAEGARTGDVLDYVAEATGEKWTAATFYTRIRNPVYCGRLAYGTTTMPTGRQRRKGDPEMVIRGHWEGLVSEEIWERANQAINARGKTQSQKRKPRAFYLLSDGIMTCARCGRPIIGGLCDGTRRYMCSARGRHCQHHSVKADLLEPLVLARVEKRLGSLNLDAIMADFEKTLQPRREEAKRQEAFLRKKLTAVRKQVANMVEAIANGMFFRELSAGVLGLAPSDWYREPRRRVERCSRVQTVRTAPSRRSAAR